MGPPPPLLQRCNVFVVGITLRNLTHKFYLPAARRFIHSMFFLSMFSILESFRLKDLGSIEHLPETRAHLAMPHNQQLGITTFFHLAITAELSLAASPILLPENLNRSECLRCHRKRPTGCIDVNAKIAMVEERRGFPLPRKRYWRRW